MLGLIIKVQIHNTAPSPVKTISALFGKNKILIKFQTWDWVWSIYSVADWPCDKQCKTNQYEHSLCS